MKNISIFIVTGILLLPTMAWAESKAVYKKGDTTFLQSYCTNEDLFDIHSSALIGVSNGHVLYQDLPLNEHVSQYREVNFSGHVTSYVAPFLTYSVYANPDWLGGQGLMPILRR